MTSRPIHLCASILVAALVAGPATGAAWAQAGLRGSETNGDFPTSPTAAPLQSPESNAPPSINASPAAADESSPSTTTRNAEDTGAPNYGKPRKRKPKLYKPSLKSNPPLSPLVPYRGAPGDQRKILNPVPAATTATVVDPIQPAPSVAVIQSPPRPKRQPVELDPYAPTGVRVGELRLLPFVEASTGYETNPNQVSVGVKPSAVLRAAGGLDVQSDFSNHSLTASLRGGYSDFPVECDGQPAGRQRHRRRSHRRHTRRSDQSRGPFHHRHSDAGFAAARRSQQRVHHQPGADHVGGCDRRRDPPLNRLSYRPERHDRPHAIRQRDPIGRDGVSLLAIQLQRLRGRRACLLRGDAGILPVRRGRLRCARARRFRRPQRLLSRFQRDRGPGRVEGGGDQPRHRHAQRRLRRPPLRPIRACRTCAVRPSTAASSTLPRRSPR